MGWGVTPTGAGLVDGGVDQGPWLQERVGSSKEGGGLGLGWLFQRGASPGKGSGGVQGLRFRGVSGRDTDPRDGKFRNVSYFCCFSHVQKEEKWCFLKDALWGGAPPHRASFKTRHLSSFCTR